MTASDDSTGLGTAEGLFNEFLVSGAGDFGALIEAHPEQAQDLEALFATWRVVEALGKREAGAAPSEASAGFGERYSQVTEVGRGGMGVVYRARDKRLGRDVAYKVQRTEAAGHEGRWLDRFYTEARINAQLDHPGVVPVHELGRDDEGCLYFTMRFVEGRTLHEILELVRTDDAEWTRPRALDVLVRVCETMAFAHSRGVVHRDLKPRNIMVGRFGEVYVMDWGVAKVLGEPDLEPDPEVDSGVDSGAPSTSPVRATETPTPSMTYAGAVVGTPAFMAPEQALDASRIDPRADVYAIGAILYQLLTGCSPYHDRPKGASLLDALRAGDPVPLAELCPKAPPELMAICNKAMERDPERRYASAERLREDLSAFLEQRVVQAYKTGFWNEFAKWYARNRRQAQALVGGTTIALLGLSTAVVLQQQKNVELLDANEKLDRALQAAGQRGYSMNIASALQFLSVGDTRAALQRLEVCPPELRGWEWDYLRARVDASLVHLELGQSDVWAARLHPARDEVAYGTGVGAVVVHDFADASVDERVLGDGGGKVIALDYDPVLEGTLVSGHLNGTVVRWDVGRGEEDARARLGKSVTALSFSSAGKLAVGVDDRIRVCPPASLTPSVEIDAHAGGVTSIAWGAAGGRFATTGQDGSVAVWDAAAGIELARFPVAAKDDLGRHRSQVCWSPDETLLAAAFPTGVWCVFEAETWTELARVTTEYWIFSVAFMDSETLVVGGTDSVAAWDWRREEVVRTWPGANGSITDIQRRDKLLLALGQARGLTFFSLEEPRGEVLAGHLEDVTAIALQPGGKLIASASRDGTARVWDVATGTCLRVFDELPVVRDSIAWGGASVLLAGLTDGSVAEWDLETGELLNRWALGKGAARSLCTSSDGRFAFAQDLRGLLRIWDRPAGGLFAELTVAKHWFKPAISRDCRLLAVVDRSRLAIDILGLPGLEAVRTLEGVHTGRIKSLSFSGDGARLVSAGEDRLVCVWDLETGDARVLRGHAREVLDAVFFESDTRVASGGVGRVIKIWNPIDGENLLTLFGHDSWALDLDASDSNRVLASSSSDRTVRLWRPTSPW